MYNEYEPVIDGTLEILDIELSAVGGSIDGILSFDETVEEEETGRLYPEIDISLHYKDGTALPMTQILSSFSGDGGIYSSYIEVGEPLHNYTVEEREKRREELQEEA